MTHPKYINSCRCLVYQALRRLDPVRCPRLSAEYVKLRHRVCHRKLVPDLPLKRCQAQVPLLFVELLNDLIQKPWGHDSSYIDAFITAFQVNSCHTMRAHHTCMCFLYGSVGQKYYNHCQWCQSDGVSDEAYSGPMLGRREAYVETLGGDVGMLLGQKSTQSFRFVFDERCSGWKIR